MGMTVSQSWAGLSLSRLKFSQGVTGATFVGFHQISASCVAGGNEARLHQEIRSTARLSLLSICDSSSGQCHGHVQPHPVKDRGREEDREGGGGRRKRKGRVGKRGGRRGGKLREGANRNHGEANISSNAAGQMELIILKAYSVL